MSTIGEEYVFNSSSCAPVLADSVTAVPSGCAGRLLVTGSHGGLYSAACALQLRAGAAVFSDAGRGLDDAGIAGLRLLDRFGVPAAAVSHLTARIGDAGDQMARGRISAVNEGASARGVQPGDFLREVWPRLSGATTPVVEDAPDLHESERLLNQDASPRVYLLDSASLVSARHRDAVVVTGSHGGLLGGRAASAIKQAVFAAFYNDAGVGIEGAGIGRLSALDGRGIAGMAVDAFSARIGDGMSTYQHGVASHVNAVAAALGIRAGMRVQEIVGMLCKARASRTTDPT